MILMWRMWLMRFLKKCTDFFSINYWVSWWWLGLFYWRLLFFYCQLWSHSTISVRTTCRARLWEPNTLLCNNLMETVSEDCTANIIFFNDPLQWWSYDVMCVCHQWRQCTLVFYDPEESLDFQKVISEVIVYVETIMFLPKWPHQHRPCKLAQLKEVFNKCPHNFILCSPSNPCALFLCKAFFQCLSWWALSLMTLKSNGLVKTFQKSLSMQIITLSSQMTPPTQVMQIDTFYYLQKLVDTSWSLE